MYHNYPLCMLPSQIFITRHICRRIGSSVFSFPAMLLSSPTEGSKENMKTIEQ